MELKPTVVDVDLVVHLAIADGFSTPTVLLRCVSHINNVFQRALSRQEGALTHIMEPLIDDKTRISLVRVSLFHRRRQLCCFTPLIP
jgi:hypothetical protein